MSLDELLIELSARKVRVVMADGRLTLRGAAEGITAELVEQVRQHKVGLRESVITGQALALLARLKGYSLPAGRIDAARIIASRCAARHLKREGGPQDRAADASSILAGFQDIERELIANGGRFDPELAKAIEAVEREFPGARFLELGPKTREGESKY
jgi:hypothetical protein